jgi:hypothetical protein
MASNAWNRKVRLCKTDKRSRRKERKRLGRQVIKTKDQKFMLAKASQGRRDEE